jgi:hypothetical protein
MLRLGSSRSNAETPDDVQHGNRSAVILGQESDVVPLPRRARAVVAPLLPESRKLAIASRVGGFIFLTAARPDCPR